ncbi:MAG: polymer-forming cytoskeletal protein, partial [Acidimicrobiia bacterium]
MRFRSSGTLLIAALFLLMLLPLPAHAELTQSDLVLVQADDVITEDLYAAGNRVQVDGRVEGDLYAAAFSEVKITGEVTGDVVVVASRLVISGRVGGSVRVASG